MQAKYMSYMYERIDEIYPGASKRIADIPELPVDIGIRILSEILGFACKAQNTAVITLAREEFKNIPVNWVNEHIHNAIDLGLDIEDEWEYRRLLELLHESQPFLYDILKFYIDKGKMSQDPENQETADDFLELITV